MTKPYSGAYSRRFSNYTVGDNNTGTGNYTVSATSSNLTMGTVGVFKLEDSAFSAASASQQAEPLRGGAVSYPSGSRIRIVAKPNDGYEFVSWTGDCPAGKANQPSIDVVLSKNIVLTANFKKAVATENVTLNIRWDGNKGRVSGTGNFVQGAGSPANSASVSGVQGNTVRLTASPLNGYRFVRWEGVQLAGNTQRNDSPTIDIALRNATITAVFEAIDANGNAGSGVSNQEIAAATSSGSGNNDVVNVAASAGASIDTGKILAFVKKWWWAIAIAAYVYYKEKGGSK